MISLTDLNYFIEIARVQSMRRAAEHLNLAPSALSRHIARIERTIGEMLFERRPEGVHLTPSGRIFLQHATEMLNRYDDLCVKLNRLRELREGHVQIATVEGITRGFLTQQIARFRREHHPISFHVEVLSRDRVLESVVDYGCEIGVVYDHFSNEVVQPLGQWRQPLLALAPPSHLYADGRLLELADLAVHECTLPDESFAIRRLVDHSFRKAGLKLRVGLTANQLQILIAYSIESGAILFAPLQAVRYEVEQGLLKPLALDFRPFEHRHIIAVKRRDRVQSVAAQAFLETLILAFAEGEQADVVLLDRVMARRPVHG